MLSRVDLIADADGALLSLDLKNPQVAKRLGEATNDTDVRKIFSDFGGAY